MSWGLGEERERESTRVGRVLLFKVALVLVSVPQEGSNSSKVMPPSGSEEKYEKEARRRKTTEDRRT